MAYKPMNKCWTQLSPRKCKLKSQCDNTKNPQEWLKCSDRQHQVLETGYKRNIHGSLLGVHNGTATSASCLVVSAKAEHCLPTCNPATSLRGTYLMATCTHTHHKDIPSCPYSQDPKPGNNPNIYQQQKGHINCGMLMQGHTIERSAHFSYEGLDSKYVRFCRPTQSLSYILCLFSYNPVRT